MSFEGFIRALSEISKVTKEISKVTTDRDSGDEDDFNGTKEFTVMTFSQDTNGWIESGRFLLNETQIKVGGQIDFDGKIRTIQKFDLTSFSMSRVYVK